METFKDNVNIALLRFRRGLVQVAHTWLSGNDIDLPWIGLLLVSLLLFTVFAVINGFGFAYLTTVLTAEGSRHTQYLLTILFSVGLGLNLICGFVQFVAAPFVALFNDNVALADRDQFISRLRWFFFWTVAASLPSLWR